MAQEFEHKDKMLVGYKVIYKPDHFNHTLNKKNYNGYVYEHRYVMECAIGRPLTKEENVHHKDGNKLNNDINNLELTTRAEHVHKHYGYQQYATCQICGKKLSSSRPKLCRECFEYQKRKVKVRPPKEKLLKMISESSVCAVARKYGVTDNAIRKWLK